MTTSHANCDHLMNREDRAACRKVRAERAALAVEILDYFDRRGMDVADWLTRGAYDFCDAYGKNLTRLEMATALLDYFYPASEAARAYKVANGYILTKDPVNMLHVILRRNS